MRKRIGIKERKLIMADQNQSNLSGIVKLMKQVLYLILLIEFVGGLILSMYFLKYYDVQGAFYTGFSLVSVQQPMEALILQGIR